MSSLEVTIGKLSLRNPTVLASGVMDETAGSLLKVARAGAGAIVTKSIGSEPRKGYPNPTIVELDDGYINAMGLSNPGIEAFAAEMLEVRSCPVPVIGSIFGSSAKEFSFLASKMQDYGAAAVELNLSCPHAKGYGMEIGVDSEMVAAVVREAKSVCSIPVFAKLTPNTHQLKDLAKAVETAGADAIVTVNTVKAMAISVEMRRPILSNKGGGLSGPAIKPIGLRCVYDIYSTVNIPIIGVGGVENWRDAVEYIMAGASAIQVGSGVGRVGLQVFESICSGMKDFMDREGFGSVNEMVGVAHE